MGWLLDRRNGYGGWALHLIEEKQDEGRGDTSNRHCRRKLERHSSRILLLAIAVTTERGTDAASSRRGQDTPKMRRMLMFRRIEVKDISLTDYINVNHAVYVPHTAGRYAKKQFAKGRMPIVERLVNA